jgi:hypothetical protein
MTAQQSSRGDALHRRAGDDCTVNITVISCSITQLPICRTPTKREPVKICSKRIRPRRSLPVCSPVRA